MRNQLRISNPSALTDLGACQPGPNPQPVADFKCDSAVVFEGTANKTKSRTGAGFERPRKSPTGWGFQIQAANRQALADFRRQSPNTNALSYLLPHSVKFVSADEFGK
ncbi:hypothetical protein [uncultured Oscillibacter sp.]|uniref:hypothetical protein n=1 Tax=uncultured Oscillibacter sp. TaxID=876091 RepID=UPI00261008D3|nr:hypothetical protein [uncultured Oscillibacter sp.]